MDRICSRTLWCALLLWKRDFLTNFNTLGLAEPLLRALCAEGYTTATPIQTEVIPAMLAGRDVLGIAQTGTGKTAAFVLPLLQRILDRQTMRKPKHCGALILAPTRELAQQIAANIKAYSAFAKVSVAVIVGGVKPRPQVRALAAGVDIIVATPGRLLDHMNAGALHLDLTTSVVLDEADHMLDLGFVPAIRKIMARLPKARQTVLMSATMPKQIRKLAADFQTEPQEISVARVSRPIERVAQSVQHVAAGDKRAVLAGLLRDADDARAIVFTRTKHGADRVSRHLEAAGLPSAAIHGNKSQPQRERALAGFRSGRITVLVATDIAARGIDIDGVSHVINFELPNVPETYVHRIGRTARAGQSGIAVSLCAPEERKLLKDIEKLIGNRIDVQDATPESGSEQISIRPRAKKPAATATGPGRRTPPDLTRRARPSAGRPIAAPAQSSNDHKARPSAGSAMIRRKQADMNTGTVKWFNGAKGYGFIAPQDGSKDVFVHISAVERAGLPGLNEGDTLSYDLEVDKARGKSSAINLQTQ